VSAAAGVADRENGVGLRGGTRKTHCNGRNVIRKYSPGPARHFIVVRFRLPFLMNSGVEMTYVKCDYPFSCNDF